MTVTLADIQAARRILRDVIITTPILPAERLSQEVLSLPVHPGLAVEDLHRVIEAVWESLTDR